MSFQELCEKYRKEICSCCKNENIGECNICKTEDGVRCSNYRKDKSKIKKTKLEEIIMLDRKNKKMSG